MVNAKYYFEMGVVLGRLQYFTKKKVFWTSQKLRQKFAFLFLSSFAF